MCPFSLETEKVNLVPPNFIIYVPRLRISVILRRRGHCRGGYEGDRGDNKNKHYIT